jgi:hypothetical protein
MSDPARWGALNESEREVLRAAHVLRVAGLTPAPSVAAEPAYRRHMLELLERVGKCCAFLTDTDPPEAVIAMPEGWEVVDAIIPAGAVFLLHQGSNVMGFWRGHVHMGDNYLDDDFRVPESAVRALMLRAAGLRVEGPHD